MIWIDERAQAIASSTSISIFLRSWSGPEVIARTRLSPAGSSVGNHAGPASVSPVVKYHCPANASHSCATTGPSNRKWVSSTA